MIAGFESSEHIHSTLAALEREARGHIRDERHRDSIRAQIEIFQAEADRIEAEETARIKAESATRLEAAKRRRRA